MDTKQLFSFDGRIGRGAFWGLQAAGTAVGLVGGALLQAMESSPLLGILGLAVLLVALAVSLTTAVKRWHDRDKAGTWVLIGLVPLVGSVWSLVETGFLPGTDGDNRFGPPSGGSPFGG